MDTIRPPHATPRPGFPPENRAHTPEVPGAHSSLDPHPVTAHRANGVAQPSTGQLAYEVDSPGHRVVARYPDGRIAFAFGAFGHGAGQFDTPLDIVTIRPEFRGEPTSAQMDAANLFSSWLAVADYGNHRVQFFECDGAWVGETELDPGQVVFDLDPPVGVGDDHRAGVGVDGGDFAVLADLDAVAGDDAFEFVGEFLRERRDLLFEVIALLGGRLVGTDDRGAGRGPRLHRLADPAALRAWLDALAKMGSALAFPPEAVPKPAPAATATETPTGVLSERPINAPSGRVAASGWKVQDGDPGTSDTPEGRVSVSRPA